MNFCMQTYIDSKGDKWDRKREQLPPQKHKTHDIKIRLDFTKNSIFLIMFIYFIFLIWTYNISSSGLIGPFKYIAFFVKLEEANDSFYLVSCLTSTLLRWRFYWSSPSELDIGSWCQPPHPTTHQQTSVRVESSRARQAGSLKQPILFSILLLCNM